MWVDAPSRIHALVSCDLLYQDLLEMLGLMLWWTARSQSGLSGRLLRPPGPNDAVAVSVVAVAVEREGGQPWDSGM